QVESRLVEHKDREIKYCEKIRGLEFRTESSNDYIEILKKELKTLKKEKEGDIDNLFESQRSDKNKEGLGYNVVPPPPAQIYSSPKKDLSWTGLPEEVPRTTLMTKAIGTVAALGGCKITGKGTIKTDKLEFENIYFVKDLKYNLFSVSQICDN
nr:ribonuclease H-like domain-containing protein [Tanacetum cinerariifolium]